MSKSMSLSRVIVPAAAEPKRMILSGLTTAKTRRTISSISFWSILTVSLKKLHRDLLPS